MEKKRLEYMDMAKGAGIIGIVIMHSSTMPDRVVGWLSSFALPLFFLISGMLMSHGREKERGMKELLCRKGRSLMIPFLGFSLIYIALLIREWRNGIYDWETVRGSMLAFVTLKGGSVVWFLPALFIAECVFLPIVKRLSMVGTCLISLILTVVSYMGNALLAEQGAAASTGILMLSDFLRTFLRAAYALPLICAGYYLFERYRDFWERGGRFSAGQMIGGICLFLGGIPLSMANGSVDFRTMVMGRIPALEYLSVMLSSVGLLLICKNSTPFKPLLFYGKNSLIVMATHMDFYFVYYGHVLAYWVNDYIPRLNRVCFFVNVIGIVLILEVPCIMIINRFFPFLAGRRKRMNPAAIACGIHETMKFRYG